MEVQRYDQTTGKWIKVSGVRWRPGASSDDIPFSQQVMNGYRRAEERGQRINGNAAKIKKIWAQH